MSMIGQFFRRIWFLIHRRRFEGELQEEMALHRDMMESAGRSGFGSELRLREEARDIWGWLWLDHLGQDLRFAVRIMRRSRGFTAAAMIALAVGIGANTAIFSVIYTVMFRPLPYPGAERMVMVWETRSDLDPSRFPDPKAVLRMANRWAPDDRTLAFWKERNQCFENLAGFVTWVANFTGGGEPERIEGAAVTPEFFHLLGTQPMLGRSFLPDENSGGHDEVIILGYGLWQRRYGSDPGVLGRMLTVDGAPHTVVGVMPASLELVLPDMLRRPDFYVPLRHTMVLNPGSSFTISPVAGRLKPGISINQAQSGMSALAAARQQQSPRYKGRGVRLAPLASEISSESRPAMLVLLGATGSVLLLCCANVANLLLARASARQNEIGMRTVLGAGAWRVARQMLTESLVLGLSGGLLGLVMAVWGVRALVAVIPQFTIPRLEDVRVDGPVLAFGVTLSLLTALLFGLVPAIEAAQRRHGPAEMLRSGTGRQTASGYSHNARRILVAAEVAIAMVLLTGAGLLIRSFIRLRAVDLGFRRDHVITGTMIARGSGEVARQRQAEFIERVLRRVRSIPSVQAAAFASRAPMAGDITVSVSGFKIEGLPESDMSAMLVTCTPGYFRTIGANLRKGRDFTSSDAAAGAAIVNEAFVRRYFPSLPSGLPEPLGRSLQLNKQNLPVVGILSDMRTSGPGSDIEPEVFITHTSSFSQGLVLLVRTTGNPMEIAPLLRDAVRGADPDQPLDRITTMEQAVAGSVAQPRFQMLLLILFAGVALVLAATGIGGVVAYSVARRSHEIGIRIAMGASRGSVFRMVVGQTLVQALAGIAIGVAASAALTRFMAGFLFEIKPFDATTLILGSILLAALATAASWLPAHRAMRIDPQTALRAE